MPRALETSAGWHALGEARLALTAWRPPAPVLAVSSASLGGGTGLRSWVLSATVDADYGHPRPDEHLRSIAAREGLPGEGVGFLTAVDVRDACWASDGGAEALVTVGLGWPTWAAAPPGAEDGDVGPDPPRVGRPPVGTVNVLVWSPARLADAALVNAVVTATEAKTQALVELGVPGTGTASDAIAVCCPPDGPAEPYGGPRSVWGARLARAVHRAVLEGARADRERARAAGHPRP